MLFGWLKVNNTNINYPVVQTTNNNYYLNHSYNGTYNRSGSIFADYKNNLKELDQNTILYGHNRRNGAMFSPLNSNLSSSWYSNTENHFINFNTLTMSGVWQIFSTYKVKSSKTLNKISFSTNTEFLNYINSAKQKSIYNFNVNVDNDDKILTLYTCGNNTFYRVIVHAKLLK